MCDTSFSILVETCFSKSPCFPSSCCSFSARNSCLHFPSASSSGSRFVSRYRSRSRTSARSFSFASLAKAAFSSIAFVRFSSSSSISSTTFRSRLRSSSSLCSCVCRIRNFFSRSTPNSFRHFSTSFALFSSPGSTTSSDRWCSLNSKLVCFSRAAVSTCWISASHRAATSRTKSALHCFRSPCTASSFLCRSSTSVCRPTFSASRVLEKYSCAVKILVSNERALASSFDLQVSSTSRIMSRILISVLPTRSCVSRYFSWNSSLERRT
mmetsp:Transcript_24434/g.61416  ORF Transcript_24434/g.61416 Transcript_24434/m.61416 type:complete len:268 (+) Transcript_24434:2249-3052(+)